MGSSPDPNALAPLRDFITGLAALLDQQPDETRILREGGALLATLVARDDWLPEAWAQPHPEYYQQHLLHCDSAERFSIVSFVWGPGQRTPIHDHTVWGLIGMLRGAEDAQAFALDAGGRPVASGANVRLLPGQVEAVSPAVGDIHRVNNVYDDRVSVSIHVYGANIGAVRRSVYAEDGTRKPFVSGYSNQTLPNPWDRSRELSQS
ncbi:putative Cysteine dioxygenase type I [Cupriavidus phytorum]|uniref:Cysteine dioxygenase type I n=2 Tax=Cupriavidus TaxID=106589 RepID=A0A375CI73_9BURK|nr:MULTISPECIES: cysteine dioxygenase [Cupriavidus]PZX34457.1 putative metal-dependent enzyme (double-stranded beta helix superfamily) [Cupriavidus alkaliphilus]SOY71566.1 putative Cysteine dioxygenase type I [Cupriavidus taiwanensis]